MTTKLTPSNETLALMKHLNIGATEAQELIDNGTFEVLDEYDAKQAFKDRMENYIDDCILPELPEQYRYYFDTKSFIRDVEMSDGRGPTMSAWDGVEHEVSLDGYYYFIYQQDHY